MALYKMKVWKEPRENKNQMCRLQQQTLSRSQVARLAACRPHFALAHPSVRRSTTNVITLMQKLFIGRYGFLVTLAKHLAQRSSNYDIKSCGLLEKNK